MSVGTLRFREIPGGRISSEASDNIINMLGQDLWLQAMAAGPP